jgi:hypothetical protein
MVGCRHLRVGRFLGDSDSEDKWLSTFRLVDQSALADFRGVSSNKLKLVHS